MKFSYLVLCALFLCTMLTPLFGACGSTSSGKTSIVCTIFPEYDWVTNILGDQKDNFEVSLICNNGADMHSFNPSFADTDRIMNADLFIYVGGESDAWVKKVLANSSKEDMKVVNLLGVLGEQAKEEEVVEGMQTETESQDGENEVEYDEHVWLSIKNAVTFVEEIAASIIKLDEENKTAYQTNATNYIQKLKKLDNEYSVFTSTASKNTLIFGDRFPFRYLVDDYNLNYYAAFSGCSAETEASFETLDFLAQKINDLNIKVILQLETTSQGNKKTIAEAVRENTRSKGQTILTINSIQNTTTRDNLTYLDIMTNNLSIIRQALN